MERYHPLAKCEECPLYKNKNYVPTEANGTELHIIGEAPGGTESKTGRPFTGQSGKLLEIALKQHDISRETCTLTNVVACRPRGNQDPPPEAIEACRPRLEADLDSAHTILATGNTAASAVLGRKTKITRDRVGPPKISPRYPNTRIVPTIHPAACLRSPDAYPNLVTDIGKLKTSAHTEWVNPEYRVFGADEDTVGGAKIALQQLLQREDLDPIAADIEVGEDKDEEFGHPERLLSIAISYAGTKAIVIGECGLREARVRELLAEVLCAKRTIWHNAAYDLGVLYRLGIVSTRAHWDTMLASYVLDERGGTHGLKYLAKELLGAPDWDAELKEQGGFQDAPRHVLYKYNAYDAVATYRLYELQQSTPQWGEQEERLNSFLLRAQYVLMHIAEEGIKIDQEALAELAEELEDDIYESVLALQPQEGLNALMDIQDSIEEYGIPQPLPSEKLEKAKKDGRYFNPNSPQQVKARLKDMGVKTQSTDVEHLTNIINQINDALTNKRRMALLKSEEIKKYEKVRSFCEDILAYRKVVKLYGCVDEETEILTSRGWLKFSEVREGDFTLAINPDTGLSEWNIVEGVHLYPGTHEVVRHEGRDFSACTTHDHKWLSNHTGEFGITPGYKWRTTDTLAFGDRIPKAVPCSDIPTTPKYEDHIVELVAWIWTEGSKDMKGLNIIQSHKVNQSNVDRIRAALVALCPNPIKSNSWGDKNRYWSERKATSDITEFYINEELAKDLKPAFISGHKMVDPRFILNLTKSQLELFVMVSMLADGCTPKKSGQGLPRIKQSIKEQLFALQLACALLGKPTSNGIDGKYHSLGIQSVLYFNPRASEYRGKKTGKGMQVTSETYEGTVWCVSTPNHNWLARRKGKVYYTGNTYVKGVQTRLHNGRIHTTYLLHGTTTGRTSSRNINIQNIPRGEKIRSIYIPETGNAFAQLDFKNIEGRVVFYLAKSYSGRTILESGRDIHGEVASQAFGSDYTYEERVYAKTIVHGTNYGRTPHGIASDPRIGVSLAKANELYLAYQALVPEVFEWHKEMERRIFSNEDLVTPFGRKRRFALVTRDNREDVYKEGLAFLPQSIASDITLHACIALWERGFHIRNFVHDSVLIEAPQEEAEDQAKEAQKIMEQTAADVFTDWISWPVDYEIGKSWGELV